MDAAMWLHKEWLFWSRLVRYHVLRVGAVRAPDATGIQLRLLGQVSLVTILLIGGYLAGRVTAPGCTPVANAVCAEAQVLPTAPPTSPALDRQVVIVTAEVPPPSAPAPPSPSAEPTPPPPTVEAVPPLPENKRAERLAALTSDEVREMQAWLKAFGFDPGPIDGYAGARTKSAIRRYQAARRTEETGELDRSLLRKVRREAGHS